MEILVTFSNPHKKSLTEVKNFSQSIVAKDSNGKKKQQNKNITCWHAAYVQSTQCLEHDRHDSPICLEIVMLTICF